MLSKKSEDVLNVVRNVYKIVEGKEEAGYEGDMRKLIQDAIKKTAFEGDKKYGTVESNITRGLDLFGDGAMDEVCEMIEEACMGKGLDHSGDKLLKYLLDTRNSKDDAATIQAEYQKLFF